MKIGIRNRFRIRYRSQIKVAQAVLIHADHLASIISQNDVVEVQNATWDTQIPPNKPIALGRYHPA